MDRLDVKIPLDVLITLLFRDKQSNILPTYDPKTVGVVLADGFKGRGLYSLVRNMFHVVYQPWIEKLKDFFNGGDSFKQLYLEYPFLFETKNINWMSPQMDILINSGELPKKDTDGNIEQGP